MTDPKDTVDKLNKSKLTGNVNVNKMVLPLVSCWWCSLLLLLTPCFQNVGRLISEYVDRLRYIR